MRLVNKCPHEIKLYDEAGQHVCDLPPDGTPVRVSAERRLVGRTEEGVPIFSTIYSHLDGVPPKIEGVAYVVSGLVVSACPEREDFYQPGELLRDSQGNVVGAVGVTRPERR